MRERLNRRREIEKMLTEWSPDDSVHTDEIRLTEQRVAVLNKRDLKAWQRIRTRLGTDVISISRVRSVLKPREQDTLYRILRRVLEQEQPEE